MYDLVIFKLLFVEYYINVNGNNQINNSKIVIETIHNYLSKEYIGNDIRMYCSLFTNLNEISDKTVVDYIN